MIEQTDRFVPMLATSISEKGARSYLGHEDYALQQKVDGQRCVLDSRGGGLRAWGRGGSQREVPKDIAIPEDCVIDGEVVEGKFYAFDLVYFQTNPYPWKYIHRHTLLDEIFASSDVVTVLPLVIGTAQKTRMFELYERLGCEGVMFKYLPGNYHHRRSTTWRKYKFVKEVDCVIIDRGIDGRNNFELGVYRDNELVSVGKVSANTGDGEILEIGDVVAVTCLYATKGNRLYQPTRPKLRTDKAPEECVIEQLYDIRTNKEVQTTLERNQ